MENSTGTPIHKIVNLERYPISDLQSDAARELVLYCRKELDETGNCELNGFVTPLGLERLVMESRDMEDLAYHNALVGNAYLDEPDPSLPADHARKLTEPTSLGAVAYDQIPKVATLRQIFEWDPLMLFIKEVLQLDKIYRYADPMGALNLAVMKDGDYLRWHFDQTDFVSSLSIQQPEEGGYFEYVPMIRNSKEENYDRVKSVIRGSREGVVTVPNEPGSLVLFKGRYSLHRVTPIKGKRTRYIGLFGFDTKEGVVSSDHLRNMRYGRTQPYAQ